MAIEDAERLAQERASANAKEVEGQARLLDSVREAQKKPPAAKTTANSDLTSYDDFMEEYKTAFVKTSTGNTYEVQGLSPGDFMIIVGSPLSKALSGFGLDLRDPLSAMQAMNKLPDDQKVDLLVGETFQEFARIVVCAGVISLNLVDKPQAECDRSAEEISVSLLRFLDLCELFNAIIKLTASEEEIGMVEFFRETGEEASEERDQSPRVREGIPSETIGASVSEETQS